MWADPTPDGSSASLQLLASAPPTFSWIGGGQRPNAPTHNRNHFGPPKFLAFLSTHATLFVDPGRSSEGSPKCPLRVGFSHRTLGRCGTVTPSPPALSSVTRLYQDFRERGLPCGLRGSLCTLQLLRSALGPPFSSLAPPQQLQHSVRVAGWALPGRDFHPARNAKLCLAHNEKAQPPAACLCGTFAYQPTGLRGPRDPLRPSCRSAAAGGWARKPPH